MAPKHNIPSNKGKGTCHAAALMASISKTNDVVSDSLRQSIRQHNRGEDYDACLDGMDFLDAKNSMMLSYLIDLMLMLRYRLTDRLRRWPRSVGSDDQDNGSRVGEGGEGRKREHQQCLERLLETKTALEKARPLEKRMRYQIDKLLALSTLGASTFASEGRDRDEGAVDEIDSFPVGEKDCHDKSRLKENDPLSHKPDLSGMMKIFQENKNIQPERNDGGSHEESESSSKGVGLDDNDDSNYDDHPHPSGGGGVYRPPRLQSMPFNLDNQERNSARERHLLQKQRERMSKSDIAEVVRSQLTDAPEVEDARGGAMLGRQSEASRRIAARDADIQGFEESQMIRLTMGKKEKKERKKMMRDEMSNLGAISGGLGGVMAGLDKISGGDEGRKLKYGARSGSFTMKGMRKRRVDDLNQDQKCGINRQSKKKKSSATNEYQKSLFGEGLASKRSQKK